MPLPSLTLPEEPALKMLTAKCYCGSLHYGLRLPMDLLPLSAYMCHCSRCRYTYGAMSATLAKIPHGIRPQFIEPSSLDASTTMYRSEGSNFDYYFCTMCGCHMGRRCPAKDIWHLSIAILPHDESFFTIDEHCFTKSAPGGLHEWLPSIGNRPLKVANPDDAFIDIAPRISMHSYADERLQAQCDCGGISFSISRPTDEVSKDPYMQGFISPLDKTKWKAITDACNDCRMMTGVHLNAWTYVPLKLIKPEMDRTLKHGTMKSHTSSPGTVRTFCKVCGATALYWSETRHTTDVNDVVNIAVGLLRAPEGVNAENWLTWRTNELGWLDAGREYAQDLYESLNKGHQDWGKKAHGCLTDFKLPKASIPPDDA